MQSLHPVSLCSQPNTHSTSLSLTLSTGPAAAADEKFKAAMQTSSDVKEKKKKKQDENVRTEAVTAVYLDPMTTGHILISTIPKVVQWAFPVWIRNT